MSIMTKNSFSEKKKNIDEAASNGRVPMYIQYSLWAVGSAFLAFSIYWALYSVYWVYFISNVLPRLSSYLNSIYGHAEFLTPLMAVQEYSASISCFLGLVGASLGVQSLALLAKNKAVYVEKLSLAILFVALSYLLLLPSSINHLVDLGLFGKSIDLFVGLSYLIQVVLIAPPLLMVSRKLKRPENPLSIIKWVSFAAPLFILALWVKYLLLWVDTFLPFGPRYSSAATTVGAANSIVTLLAAGVLMAAGCLSYGKNVRRAKILVGASLVLFGAFFMVYSVVSIWVHVYSSFWWLTDFWLLISPVLGVAIIWWSKN